MVHHGGRGQSFVYELVYEPDAEPLDDRSRAWKRRSRGQAPPRRGVRGVVAPHETRMNTGANGVFARKQQNGTDTGVGENPVVAVAIGGR